LSGGDCRIQEGEVAVRCFVQAKRGRRGDDLRGMPGDGSGVGDSEVTELLLSWLRHRYFKTNTSEGLSLGTRKGQVKAKNTAEGANFR